MMQDGGIYIHDDSNDYVVAGDDIDNDHVADGDNDDDSELCSYCKV